MLVVFGLWGCSPGGDEGQDPQAMLASYQAKVPEGTSLRTARAIMESEGFTVTDSNGEAWKGMKGFTFLRCVRDDGTVIKRRWEFAVMHNGHFVTAIEIRPGLVYP